MFNHIFRINILVEGKLQLLKFLSQKLEFCTTAKTVTFIFVGIQWLCLIFSVKLVYIFVHTFNFVKKIKEVQIL